MIDLAFWHYLENQRTSGKLTRERAEMCQYDLSEVLKLLQEFINHDTLETGFLIQECLNGWMHHHEVLRKK